MTMPSGPWPAAVPDPPSRGYALTRVSDVRPRPITWLVPGRIPFGAVTILAGRPGKGKSQFTLAIAAHLSRQGVPSIFIGDEDGLEDTVRPRLMAADAQLELVHHFTATEGADTMPAVLPTDVPLLKRAVTETGAGMVVIDPIAAHLAAEANSNNDHSVRQSIGPLVRMAQATGVAVVIVAHFKKSREGSPLDWISGVYGGQIRSALLFGEAKKSDWHDRNKRYLCHVKCNGAPMANTVECRVEGITVYDAGLSIPTSMVSFDLADERTDVNSWDLA